MPIFQMTKEQANRFGLIICECGYPENNHHDFGGDNTPCAFNDDCKKFRLRANGKFILHNDERELINRIERGLRNGSLNLDEATKEAFADRDFIMDAYRKNKRKMSFMDAAVQADRSWLRKIFGV